MKGKLKLLFEFQEWRALSFEIFLAVERRAANKHSLPPDSPPGIAP